MIPVVLLAKCSVFEMLWLASDIKQAHGTFVFCQSYTQLVTEEVDGDWCSTVALSWSV